MPTTLAEHFTGHMSRKRDFIHSVLSRLKKELNTEPAPPLHLIVEILRTNAEVLVDSFADRIGRYKGKVRPAHIRREIHCLLHAADLLEAQIKNTPGKL